MDKPRKLTEEEIQDILSVVPSIKSADPTVSQYNIKSLKKNLREQLQEIELTPLGISDIKEDIIKNFNFCRVRPGEMVGTLSSDSLSSKLTQGALNSFHTAGSSKNVSSGMDRIRELMDASQNPKSENSTIYFKDQHYSFDDIISLKRPEFTEITVGRLVLGIPDIETYGEFEEPYWYPMFRTFVRSDFKSKDVLRLKLDVNALYAYKLTMENICSKIEQDGSVICVYSPIEEGRIDIYPVESAISSKLKNKEIISYENAALIFLSMIVIPSLDDIIVSGVKGIKQIYPVEAKVLQILVEERKHEKGWFLILNTHRMKVTGISVEKMARLCEVCGVKIYKIRPNYLDVAIEGNLQASPTEHIKKLISLDEKEEKEYEKAMKAKGARNVYRPPTEISKASKLIYADTDGTNLMELLNNPQIDSTRTVSNNIHEIRKVLGIEAARNFLIMALIEAIGNEGYINPRHVVLLADYMTVLGLVYGVTFSGISRQSIGALEKASFEKAMDTFIEAAGFGEESTVSSTSAAIYLGQTAPIGTGFTKDYLPPERLKRYNEMREQIMKNDNIVLDVSSFKDAISASLGEISTGEVAVLEGMEDEMFGNIGVEKEPDLNEQPKLVKIAKPAKITSKLTVSDDPKLLIKSKQIRSVELEKAADKLTKMMDDATCGIAPKPVKSFHVREGGKVSDSVPVLNKPTPTNVYEELKELEKSLHNLPLPVPMPIPVAKPVPKANPVKIFSLEDFMK